MGRWWAAKARLGGTGRERSCSGSLHPAAAAVRCRAVQGDAVHVRYMCSAYLHAGQQLAQRSEAGHLALEGIPRRGTGVGCAPGAVGRRWGASGKEWRGAAAERGSAEQSPSSAPAGGAPEMKPLASSSPSCSSCWCRLAERVGEMEGDRSEKKVLWMGRTPTCKQGMCTRREGGREGGGERRAGGEAGRRGGSSSQRRGSAACSLGLDGRTVWRRQWPQACRSARRQAAALLERCRAQPHLYPCPPPPHHTYTPPPPATCLSRLACFSHSPTCPPSPPHTTHTRDLTSPATHLTLISPTGTPRWRSAATLAATLPAMLASSGMWM